MYPACECEVSSSPLHGVDAVLGVKTNGGAEMAMKVFPELGSRTAGGSVGIVKCNDEKSVEVG